VPPLALAVKVTDVPAGCGAATLGVIEFKTSGPAGGVVMTYAMVAWACGASTVLPPLRAQTVICALATALDGVQVNVLLELQSCAVMKLAPPSVETRHLNWYGAVPPLAVAENVTLVPVACGDGTFEVRLPIDSGAAPAVIAKPMLPFEFAFS
jgi:hypothetical protein